MSREHLHGERGEPRLGVAHGRRRVAVDRAEVALPVHQRVAHRRSPAPGAPASGRRRSRRAGGSCPTCRRRSWRTSGSRGPGARFRSFIATRMRRCEGLSPSRTSGQRARDDDGHRVVDVAGLHLVFDAQTSTIFDAVVQGHVDLPSVAASAAGPPPAAGHRVEVVTPSGRSPAPGRTPACPVVGPSISLSRRRARASIAPCHRTRARPSSSARRRPGGAEHAASRRRMTCPRTSRSWRP